MSGFEWSVWAILGMVESFFLVLWLIYKIVDFNSGEDNDYHSESYR